MRALDALPALDVAVGGLPADAAPSLSEVRVHQRLSLPALCELTFAHPVHAAPGPLPGASLRVALPARGEALFEGEVSAVAYEHAPDQARTVRVRGYDALHALRRRQPARAHVQVTPAELAAELTADLGLAVHAACPGPLWPHILQAGQTDLELLAEIGERCGLYLTLRGGALHLITLEGLDGPVPLALGDTLLEARVEMNRDGSCPAVHALAWDTSRAEARRGGAKAARSGRATPAADLRPWPRGGERTLVDAVGPADEHAAALAQGELDRAAAGELHLWGVAQGDPRLRPGCRIEVAGLPGGLSGRYVITGANHVITPATGYVTEIWTAPPPPQPRAQAGLVTLGMVTRVDDPEGLGRVRVRLPTCGDAETDWTQVVCPGAGPDKGLTVLPDVGDRVLVVGSRAEPAHAIVIGGLCGAEGARDPGVEGGAVRRYTLRSAGGLRVRLDDTEGAIRIETGDGSFLELAPGGVRLHAKAPLVIEAPGQPVVVRGASIDFERA